MNPHLFAGWIMTPQGYARMCEALEREGLISEEEADYHGPGWRDVRAARAPSSPPSHAP